MSCSQDRNAFGLEVLAGFYPESKEAGEVADLMARVRSLDTQHGPTPDLAEVRTRLEALPVLVEGLELERARLRAQQNALLTLENQLQGELSALAATLDELAGVEPSRPGAPHS